MAEGVEMQCNGHTEDIYEGITDRLENMLCMRCHDLNPLRILPCPHNHLFCESCMDWQLIQRSCTSCKKGFPIPPGGVTSMVNDVTHEQIKDVLDSLCTLRTTNCCVCALDDSHAKLAVKIYKYSREENVFVCEKCTQQCEKDLDLQAYNDLPESVDSTPSAPTSTLPYHNRPDIVLDKDMEKSGQLSLDTRDIPPAKMNEREITEVNGHQDSSSDEDEEVDQPDSKPFNKPHPVSPTSDDLSFNGDTWTPPPAYESDSHSACSSDAPALPPKHPLENNDNVQTMDPPLMAMDWEHMGPPFQRANDVIILPTDKSIIVADWYSGHIHRFDDTGKCTASQLLKHSPWSLVKQKSQGPWSVAYCPSQNSLFVTEIGLSTICKMSPKDLKVDKNRIQLNEVKNPAGIAILNTGQLVMTEDMFQGDHRVAIYDLHTGMKVRDWSCKDPQLVCVDRSDRIIVSRHSENCVEVYDSNAKLVTSFGDNSTLLHPMGVACDDYGNIYVTHEAAHGYKLSMWSPEGRYIADLQYWDKSHMNLTDRDTWHMRSVDVLGNRLALQGRRTLQLYHLKGLS